MEEEIEVHICELEQGPILGEKYDEVDKKYDKSRMECSNQHREEMLEASTETKESHHFKTKVFFLCVCVIASTEQHE
jgi:hypothetical protein